MRIHEDVGVRKDGWLKMNENTWGRWCQKGWVIEDEWGYMRTLVSEWMGDWRWMRIHEDVGVRKDGWLKMNENTWGRWCQNGWVIEDEWEYMMTLVSGRMGDWRWMRIHEDVGVRMDGWLKMNENTYGRWCQKGWAIEDTWGRWCPKQVSYAGISNCIPQYSVWSLKGFDRVHRWWVPSQCNDYGDGYTSPLGCTMWDRIIYTKHPWLVGNMYLTTFTDGVLMYYNIQRLSVSFAVKYTFSVIVQISS